MILYRIKMDRLVNVANNTLYSRIFILSNLGGLI
jgi:hypothetical protein